MANLAISPGSASLVEEHPVEVVPVVVAEEGDQEVVVVEVVVTIVASRAICLVTAPRADLVVVVVVVAAIEPVTTVEKQVISRVNVPPRWEVVVVVNDQIHESVTIAMVVDIYHVIVLKGEKDLTEATWNVTSAMKLVILLVTAPTLVVAVHVTMDSAVVVVVVDPVFVATTATRWDTSRAIALPWRRKLVAMRRQVGLVENCELNVRARRARAVRHATPARAIPVVFAVMNNPTV